MDNKIKRVLLIILTLLVLGPLVFIGSCLPLGYLGFAGLGNLFGSEDSMVLGIGLACVLGVIITIFILFKVIKSINNNYQ
jgi:uncharacterized BrkB/YihY/UPF0761 family membrane protein